MKTNLPTVHIAIAFDKGYITPVYVLLASIFLNNSNCQIQIHTIATGIEEAEKLRMIEYSNRNGGNMYFYNLNPEVTQGFPVPDEKEAYITLATYYRLFFSRLIPQNIKKLLYLDVDILVVGNIQELYEADIAEATIGAVMEAEMPPRPEIGILEQKNYFNAGVLLMDMFKWRTNYITEQALKIIATQADKLQYHDQDALNIVFNNSWHRLDKRYNLMKAYIPHDLSKYEYSKFLEDKIIIHYNGRNKPWHRACENKLRFLYPIYLRQSPHAHTKRYIKKAMTRQAVVRLLYSRILETYFNHPEIGTLWRKAKNIVS